jgi:hypothetical protein
VSLKIRVAPANCMPRDDSDGMGRTLANFFTFVDIGCWGVCFWWMHRISQRQNAMLKELQQQARSIEDLSREEREILKELHPTVQKIEEGVDQVKESSDRSCP